MFAWGFLKSIPGLSPPGVNKEFFIGLSKEDFTPGLSLPVKFAESKVELFTLKEFSLSSQAVS